VIGEGAHAPSLFHGAIRNSTGYYLTMSQTKHPILSAAHALLAAISGNFINVPAKVFMKYAPDVVDDSIDHLDEDTAKFTMSCTPDGEEDTGHWEYTVTVTGKFIPREEDE